MVYINSDDSLVLCVCVTCTQLTENVTLATIGALLRFLDNCRTGILRSNERSDEEAIESIITRNETIVDLYRPHEIATLNRISCPLCLPGQPIGECCGNGQCVDSTCQCNTGTMLCLMSCRWLSWQNMLTCITARSSVTVGGHYTPFKVIQGRRLWYNPKPACDFLLVINANTHLIWHRLPDIAHWTNWTTVINTVINSAVWRPALKLLF